MKAAPTAVVDGAAIPVIARSLAGQSRSERAHAHAACGARVLIVGTDVDFVDLALGRGEAGAARRAN